MARKLYLVWFMALLVAFTSVSVAGEQDVLNAIAALKSEVQSPGTLTGAQIAANKATIEVEEDLFGSGTAIMNAAFDLATTYDNAYDPLFVSQPPVPVFPDPTNGLHEFDRRKDNEESIHWAVLHVLQSIFDYGYTADYLAAHEGTLNGKIFRMSERFPGSIGSSVPRVSNYSVTINASYPDTAGWNRQGDDAPARKPTGTYLAPGAIATVNVPASMVNKGYQVRVGVHSYDLEDEGRHWVRRLDRVSAVYDITSTTTKVANPLGGGIYIEVPYLANAGNQTVTISNAVRSPFYSIGTTDSQWNNTESNFQAPFADFQTEKFMMTLPTNWVYNWNNPSGVLADWDTGADYHNTIMGFPTDRGKETYYVHVDLVTRKAFFAPGYPTSNITYNPDNDKNGYNDMFFLQGPQHADGYFIHEQTHAYFHARIEGERETWVNLPHVYVHNQGFGVDLDTAFADSMGLASNPHRTLDNTAVTWMTCLNFYPNEVGMTQGEKMYQLKGHAKYVEIADLFGWDKISNYYAGLIADDISNFNSMLSDDDHIVRLCKAAGADIRPLLHFWGVHPENPGEVARQVIQVEQLPESSIVKDRILEYKDLVPADNAAFQTFAMNWWGGQPSAAGFMTESDHAQQWDIYDTGTCNDTRAYVQRIIDLYYPQAMPPMDTTPPTATSWASVPALTTEPVGDPLNILDGSILDTMSVGDQYRVAFVTSDTHFAIYPNMDSYNDFAQSVAKSSIHYLSGATWKVIGSTADVDAKDNTSTNPDRDGDGESIYLADGVTEVADTYHRLWNEANRFSPLNKDESGNPAGLVNPSSGNFEYYSVATGSNGDGTGREDSYIGAESVTTGLCTSTTSTWMMNFGGSMYGRHHYYALSDPIALVDPDMLIIMSANISTDTENDVEYYFTCTKGNAPDSGWQGSPTYVLTAPYDNREYTFTVKARDTSNYKNETAESAAMSVTVGTPYPSCGDIDGSGGVVDLADYAKFASCWGKDPSVNTECFLANMIEFGKSKVDMLDLLAFAEVWLSISDQDVPTCSSSIIDPYAPNPDPMTFADPPYRIGDTIIAMLATEATDVSGVEYYFECVSGPGSDSEWQDSPYYEDTGLSYGDVCSYSVTARDKSVNQNVTLGSAPTVVLEPPVYQGEDATAAQGCNVSSSGDLWWTGTGYMDMGNSGDWFEWNNIDGGATGGWVSLKFTYAAGNQRNCRIFVNGVNVVDDYQFYGTDWNVAVMATIDNIQLQPGINTIRVMAHYRHGPNIDKMEVQVAE